MKGNQKKKWSILKLVQESRIYTLEIFQKSAEDGAEKTASCNERLSDER
jgi:hypothetical protein